MYNLPHMNTQEAISNRLTVLYEAHQAHKKPEQPEFRREERPVVIERTKRLWETLSDTISRVDAQIVLDNGYPVKRLTEDIGSYRVTLIGRLSPDTTEVSEIRCVYSVGEELVGELFALDPFHPEPGVGRAVKPTLAHVEHMENVASLFIG